MTNYLEGCTPANVIPDYVQSFAEASLYLTESVNDDFFEVLESCGFVNENGVIDEDAQVVTEGVGEIANKFIGALKTLWSKIQEWFGVVTKWFKEQAEKVKIHIDRIIRKVKGKTIDKIDNAMLNKVPDDKKIGTYTKYNIDVKFIKSAYAAVAGAIDLIKVGASGGQNPLQELNDAKERIDNALGSSDDKKSISEAVKKQMVVSEKKDATVKDIRSDFMKIKDYVFGKEKSELSAQYTASKNAINLAIKKLNGLKNTFFKKGKPSESEHGDKFWNRAMANAAAFCKSANMKLHHYHTAVTGLMRARFMQSAHILVVCVSAAMGKSAKDKLDSLKTKNESASLESLFEW